MFFTNLGVCVPSFLLATFLQYFLAVKLELFPIAQWESFSHTLLPSFALSAFPLSTITRLIRANMIDILKQDYIKTAILKGLSTPKIIFSHALRNAILPTIGYLGSITAHILTGSFVIEKIFAIPGLGHWFVYSISSRDYPIIMGLCIFYSFCLLSIIFLADIFYNWIDPRIKEKEAA